MALVAGMAAVTPVAIVPRYQLRIITVLDGVCKIKLFAAIRGLQDMRGVDRDRADRCIG